MEIDPPDGGEYSQEATFLSQITTNSPLTSSLAKLSGSSRGIPYEKDFHFYKNFPEFKHPVQEIDDKSKTLLERIGVSSQLWGKGQDYPSGVVIDDFDGYDWLVNINDDVLEQLDASLDEFKTAREAGAGFQVVQSRKNKRAEGAGLLQVAAKTKPKIPFHIPSIPRPQDEYKIIVNNVNQPFDHVWLQRSEDGTRVIHPLENCSVMDFVDKNTSNISPKKPESLLSTPFTFVEDVKALKQLAAKLKCVDEFAVDLEHNQYRSFQGLTCLMQISTRTEDFVIDTLKLRIHVGPYLREVFKDPTKKKVMHGADRDILWLQRDFGIYVCNMFDTGQASRVLKLERNSLEYLLHHFCAVKANKEYQNAEWRLRPLPQEMIKYAREDTHYLLYIYDLMKIRLQSDSTVSESGDPPLVEVYKRSYDICSQLYEKELLTEDSYLHIYGLQDAGFNAQQLAVVAGLCEWRDVVARTEDESTGFVLPNKTLLDIAKNMPLYTNSLRRLLKTKHPYVDRNLGSVLSIIRHSMQNAAAFEEVAEQLKERHSEKGPENSTAVSEVMPSEPHELLGTITEAEKLVVSSGSNNIELALSSGHTHVENQQVYLSESSSANKETGRDNLLIPRVDCGVSDRSGENRATIQVQNKPNRAFGALLGGSGKRKIQSDKKEDSKLEQIKSSVSFPFHSFNNSKERLQLGIEQSVTQSSNFTSKEPVANVPSGEDFIMLESNKDAKDQANEGDVAENTQENKEDDDDEVMTLSDLSSSFQKCFPSPLTRAPNGEPADKFQTSTGFLQLEPFDYEEAKKQVVFGVDRGKKQGPSATENSKNRHDKPEKKITSVSGHPRIDSGDLPQGRRRQAFPASGNRSATFR